MWNEHPPVALRRPSSMLRVNHARRHAKQAFRDRLYLSFLLCLLKVDQCSPIDRASISAGNNPDGPSPSYQCLFAPSNLAYLCSSRLLCRELTMAAEVVINLFVRYVLYKFKRETTNEVIPWGIYELNCICTCH